MQKRADMVFNGLVNVPDIDIEYKGFHIIPKRDFGNYPYQDVNTYKKGYVVVKNGMNIMPGATWSSSIIEAKVMIDSFIESNGNSELFWSIHRKKQGRDEYVEV